MIPGLNAIYWTLSSIDKLRGGGGENRGGLATSLNLNAGMDGANWPAGIPRPGTPVQSFTVPSEFGPKGGSGAGAKGPKPPEDRTALLREDLEAMKLMSVTQDGIRDALFEGNKELAIRLEYDQKVADINRDTAKALLNANYETEKTVIRAQEIVRLKDAQLQRDDELRELARDIDEAVKNTLDNLRGGITWDDTGMREIFDMRLPDAVQEAKENLTSLTDPINQIIGAATAIGDAFSTSFKGIVSGAMTAREGLSNFFESVGDYFIDMAARIAAEALKLQAIQLLQSLLSPLLGGFGIGSMSAPGLQGTGALSTAPLFPGGAFAEGGFVTGPTRALIGEGGEPEYVIPQSKMSAAMSRYSRGARGESVIAGERGPELFVPGVSGSVVSNADTRAALAQQATNRQGNDTRAMLNQQTANRQMNAGGSAMQQKPIEVKYESTVINGVEYVTTEQHQRGIALAAERGRALTLQTLQNSVKTRKRVGMA
jgi:SLT domain-containing protein